MCKRQHTRLILHADQSHWSNVCRVNHFKWTCFWSSANDMDVIILFCWILLTFLKVQCEIMLLAGPGIFELSWSCNKRISPFQWFTVQFFAVAVTLDRGSPLSGVLSCDEHFRRHMCVSPFQKPLDITAQGLLELVAGWPSLAKRFTVMIWVELGVIESSF